MCSTHIKFNIMEKFMICLALGLLLCPSATECKKSTKQQKIQYSALNCRKYVASLVDFGGKPGGQISNTDAFKAAIGNLSKHATDGGALLVVPPGQWLTGSFALTSHFTLYLQEGAEILASQKQEDYPLIAPLPSYGRGRDAAGQRYSSLITGTNLTDVVITGGNGTINGQGATWWKKFKSHQLNYTRPYLIEILYSDWVQISNLTLKDSPSWNLHPTYCSNVIIEHITVIAPVDSPNTDGINPDSCTNTRIRDSFVVSGDDCIAVKSGWDQYGIKFGRPTQNLSITRFTCISPDSAVIALGSEMSGGIQNVRAQQIYAIVSQSGVRIKTAVGRGAYVQDIYVQDMHMDTMKYMFWMTGAYGSHPDEKYNHTAYPKIDNINFRDIDAKNVTYVGSLSGITEHPFTGICMSNVNATLTPKAAGKGESTEVEEEMKKKSSLKSPWNCTDIEGQWKNVKPTPCKLLKKAKKPCDFPSDVLAIDTVELKTCSFLLS